VFTPYTFLQNSLHVAPHPSLQEKAEEKASPGANLRATITGNYWFLWFDRFGAGRIRVLMSARHAKPQDCHEKYYNYTPFKHKPWVKTTIKQNNVKVVIRKTY